MNNNLQLSAAIGALNMLMKGEFFTAYESLNISPITMEKLKSPEHWQPADEFAIRTAFDVLIHGSMMRLGLPKFKVSAEYFAMVIAMCVHPTNIRKACYFAEGTESAQDLANPNANALQRETVKAEQIFALVQMLYSVNDVRSFKEQFERKCKIELNKNLAVEPVENETVLAGGKNGKGK